MTTPRDTTFRETLVAKDIAKRQNDVLIEQPGCDLLVLTGQDRLVAIARFADTHRLAGQPDTHTTFGRRRPDSWRRAD